MAFRRIGDLIWTDDKLIRLSARQNIRPASEWVHLAMVKEPPLTVGEMRRKAIITDAEIVAAVEAYLANPKAASFEFTSGYVLDVTAAVNDHRQAKAILADKRANDAFRRTMVRTAVILATPEIK